MGSMEEPILLSTLELQMLSELDSRQFGFVKLRDESHKKHVALKAVKYLERLIIRRRSADKRGSNTDPKTYCKLGHLHLLLEDYAKSLSAYQKYYSSDPYHWKDPSFLYGVGLVYFHYNAYRWAIKSFQQVLYVDPGFSRADDVHLRLAIMYKINHDFESSLKHFRLASYAHNSSRSTFSPMEIRFHVAHLFEVQGKYKIAKDKYETLLTEDGEISTSLKADIYRHLGWMYHGVESLGDKAARIGQAVQCLQKSIEADPKSGQSLYLLGRCYASIGKVHEAFIAYRNSVDKSESNADTWCSIGVLYQQQNQPMDALQAYICAVQLDKFHTAAWTNLGILYESTMQPHDALACYTNAVGCQGNGKSSPNPNLHQRIKYLKTQLSNAPPPPPPSSSSTGNNASSSKPKQLPTVEEAWNLPISNEMTSRQPNNQPNARNKDNNNTSTTINPSATGPIIKRFRPDTSETVRPSFYLTNQQIQTLQFLQNQPTLLPQQQQLLQQLQHQLRQMQQHQQQMRQQQQLTHLRQQQQFAAATGGSNHPQQTLPNNGGDILADLQNKDLGSVSDKELEALISQQDIGSFAENLLKQIQADSGSEDHHMDVDIKKETKDEETDEKKNSEEKLPSTKDLKTCSLEDIPVELSTVYKTHKTLDLNIEMSGEDIAELCRDVGPGVGRISTSLFPQNNSPPHPPDRPKANLTKEQLLPPTPSVYLENKKDAFSPQLQEFCLQHPITVVRGIAAALKMDLGLFSTKTLVQLQSRHPIEIRVQKRQCADDNWDPSMTKQIWNCSSTTLSSTIGKYAQYQMSTFSESLREEQDRSGCRLGGEDSPNAKRNAANRKNNLNNSSATSSNNNSILKFGYNVDLSEHRKWRAQLTELMKLPAWVRVVSAGNMLSHMGYQILGMNTVKLLMNVPYARIPAHQESNNFCTINLNIGPGDCEWFGVPEEYWGVLHSLCEKHNVNYLSGSWWPNMRDLMEEEIPVYRFLQRPGDLVWVNSGCVHWVQASGWCNNISWNVGPLTYKQYSTSIERYEWNKLQFHKSVVAMTHLTWNLARNVRFTDKKLFEVIKHTLMRSLRQIILTLEYVKTVKGIEVKYHARQKNDSAHYCCQCDIEVFNIMFVREKDKKVLVFCLDCARRQGVGNLKNFVCLEEYKLSDLTDVYNSFILHSQQPVVPSALPPGPPPSIASAAAAAAALTHQQATAEIAAMQAAITPIMSAEGMAAAMQAAAAAAAGGMSQYSILPPS